MEAGGCSPDGVACCSRDKNEPEVSHTLAGDQHGGVQGSGEIGADACEGAAGIGSAACGNGAGEDSTLTARKQSDGAEADQESSAEIPAPLSLERIMAADIPMLRQRQAVYAECIAELRCECEQLSASWARKQRKEEEFVRNLQKLTRDDLQRKDAELRMKISVLEEEQSLLQDFGSRQEREQQTLRTQCDEMIAYKQSYERRLQFLMDHLVSLISKPQSDQSSDLMNLVAQEILSDGEERGLMSEQRLIVFSGHLEEARIENRLLAQTYSDAQQRTTAVHMTKCLAQKEGFDQLHSKHLRHSDSSGTPLPVVPSRSDPERKAPLPHPHRAAANERMATTSAAEACAGTPTADPVFPPFEPPPTADLSVPPQPDLAESVECSGLAAAQVGVSETQFHLEVERAGGADTANAETPFPAGQDERGTREKAAVDEREDSVSPAANGPALTSISTSSASTSASAAAAAATRNESLASNGAEDSALAPSAAAPKLGSGCQQPVEKALTPQASSDTEFESDFGCTVQHRRPEFTKDCDIHEPEACMRPTAAEQTVAVDADAGAVDVAAIPAAARTAVTVATFVDDAATSVTAESVATVTAAARIPAAAAIRSGACAAACADTPAGAGISAVASSAAGARPTTAAPSVAVGTRRSVGRTGGLPSTSASPAADAATSGRLRLSLGRAAGGSSPGRCTGVCGSPVRARILGSPAGMHRGAAVAAGSSGSRTTGGNAVAVAWQISGPGTTASAAGRGGARGGAPLTAVPAVSAAEPALVRSNADSGTGPSSTFSPASYWREVAAAQRLERRIAESLERVSFDGKVVCMSEQRSEYCFGRGTRAIVVEAHGSGGGLRASKDGGVTFEPLEDFLQALMASSPGSGRGSRVAPGGWPSASGVIDEGVRAASLSVPPQVVAAPPNCAGFLAHTAGASTPQPPRPVAFGVPRHALRKSRAPSPAVVTTPRTPSLPQPGVVSPPMPLLLSGGCLAAGNSPPSPRPELVIASLVTSPRPCADAGAAAGASVRASSAPSRHAQAPGPAGATAALAQAAECPVVVPSVVPRGGLSPRTPRSVAELLTAVPAEPIAAGVARSRAGTVVATAVRSAGTGSPRLSPSPRAQLGDVNARASSIALPVPALPLGPALPTSNAACWEPRAGSPGRPPLASSRVKVVASASPAPSLSRSGALSPPRNSFSLPSATSSAVAPCAAAVAGGGPGASMCSGAALVGATTVDAAIASVAGAPVGAGLCSGVTRAHSITVPPWR